MSAVSNMERRSPTRLLFVDDNDVARSTVPRLLAIHGFDVTAVATTENALGEIKTDSFDVLLCAVRLQRSSAIELISEMNTAQPRCICFALVDDEEEELRAALKGRALYIRKPISIENLVKAIRETLSA
jgi:two-component system, OmpR family, response regulator MprA